MIVHCPVTAFCLLIRYVALWPLLLTFWPWMQPPSSMQQWRHAAAMQSLATSTVATRLSYVHSFLQICAVMIFWELSAIVCQELQVHTYCFCLYSAFSASTLLVGRQEVHPAYKKTERWGAGVVICLERGAYLHMAQLMPPPLTVSFFSKIHIGFAFLVPAHPGSPGQKAVTDNGTVYFDNTRWQSCHC